MPKNDLTDLADWLEKKLNRKNNSRREKMKLHGKKVFELKKIISQKSKT